jgi:hypothetical protein
MVSRTLLVVAVSLAVLVQAAPASAARPVLKNACKLVTNAEIKDLMGRKPVSKAGRTAGCVWTTRRMVFGEDTGRNAEAANVELTGFKKLSDVREFYDGLTKPNGANCGEADPLLPTRRRVFGDHAHLTGCSHIVFRLGHFVGDVHTFTNNVKEASRADTRRTADLTKIFVKRLRRYRCGSLCI